MTPTADTRRRPTPESRSMVDRQIAARGIRDERVLEAFRRVPREEFVAEPFRAEAYHDRPLPIGEGQTISQPFVVALMSEALRLPPGEDTRVLEIGTGSGYAAAVLGEIAGEVVTIERHAPLARRARAVLADLGYENVRVIEGDGTRGWPERAPYHGIVVAAGGPSVPRSLRQQLAVGGRLVIPVGPPDAVQRLVVVTREGEDRWREEELGEVRFVPLIGEEGWAATPAARPATPAAAVAAAAEPFDRLEDADLAPLLSRIGEARLVLLGEATHGTSEFYRFRARLTRRLIEEKGFRFVAVEADWPDAARIDDWVRHAGRPRRGDWRAFARFPTWMWRNAEVRDFVDELTEHNRPLPPERRVAFYGLDLYSLYTSIGAVLEYLDDTDPEAAAVARQRYGCLDPWAEDPASYGAAAVSGRIDDCEAEVVSMLADLMTRALEGAEADGDRFTDALGNARVVANAERYYKVMYRGARQSWNLRDQHMYDTLRLLLEIHGAGSKAVVWAHNSHLGDASATEMGRRGEHNLGQLCRRGFGDAAYLVGFGTHAGTVAAASHWDAPMEVKRIVPSHPESYERVSHDAGIPSFLLPLAGGPAREALLRSRLERAIGVIYRPETELASHYFDAVLPRQFDEWVWFDETRAVTPLAVAELAGVPETYPFGL